MTSYSSTQTTIQPPVHWSWPHLRELLRYRELFFIFAWRDFKVRYKQTALGILWAILQPLVTMFIFTIFFGKISSISSGDIPYAVFVLTGLLFWNYFSQTLAAASNTLVENEQLIKKTYFPRIILPLSSTLTPLIDLTISFLLLITLSLITSATLHVAGFLWMPIYLLILYLTVGGLGMFFSSINIRFRDVRYVIPFLIQILLFLTPVIYPVAIVSQKYRWLLTLNPLTGIIEHARMTLFNAVNGAGLSLLVAFCISVVLFILGSLFLSNTERTFADVG